MGWETDRQTETPKVIQRNLIRGWEEGRIGGWRLKQDRPRERELFSMARDFLAMRVAVHDLLIFGEQKSILLPVAVLNMCHLFT